MRYLALYLSFFGISILNEYFLNKELRKLFFDFKFKKYKSYRNCIIYKHMDSDYSMCVSIPNSYSILIQLLPLKIISKLLLYPSFLLKVPSVEYFSLYIYINRDDGVSFKSNMFALYRHPDFIKNFGIDGKVGAVTISEFLNKTFISSLRDDKLNMLLNI